MIKPDSILRRWMTVSIIVLCAFAGVYAQSDTAMARAGAAALLRQPDAKAKVDSILTFVSRYRRNPLADTLYKQAFSLVDKLSYENGRARLLDAYGVYLRDLSKFSESLKYHQQSLALANTLKDVKTETSALNNIGVVYRRLDEYSTALGYHMQALKLAEKNKDDFSVSVALNSVGNTHIVLGNYRDAIEYFKMCLPIAEKANNRLGIAMNLNNIGDAYEHMHMLDSAQIFYEQSLEVNKTIDNPKGVAIGYNCMGNIALKKNNIPRAIQLFEMALALNKEIGDVIYEVNTNSNLGYAYYLQGNYTNAQNKYTEALNIALQISSKYEAKRAYEGLMLVAEKLGDNAAALRYSKLYKLYADSIVNENNNRHVRQMEAIYNNEKEKSEIALLQTRRKSDRILLVGGFILFALILISGFLIYLRYRLLERNRTLKRELELRTQIASDLHDDMGSTLSSINIFSELLRKKGTDSPDLLNKIETNVKHTLDALDDIIWLVKPSNDIIGTLEQHIRGYAVPLFELKGIDFDIDFPESMEQVPISMATRRNIFLILKESVNNLIKYSNCKRATITAALLPDIVRFTVTDDGKGFDVNADTNRNGLKNITTRAKQINATISIHSKFGEGTTVLLDLPMA